MAIGDGLQSLIPPKGSNQKGTNDVLQIEIEKIKPNPYQPRKHFDKAKLQELADSIKEHGILQSLVVNRAGDGYQLIAGERRLEAAKIAGLSKVPAVIRNSSEQEKLELALVENLQRDNLNPIERGYAFKKLIDQFNFTQQDVGKRISKSRESVANTLRLLELPAEIQRAIMENRISEGHGRVILALPDTEKRLLLSKEIISKKLSVRQAEAKVMEIIKSLPDQAKPKSRKDPQLKELEEKLSDSLGTRVKLTKKGQKGKITIEFFSQEELKNIINKLIKS